MFTSDYSFDESVLTSKQLTAFSQSETLFKSWAEEHSPAEIQAAIIELNAFKAKNDAAIDEQLQRQRDDATIAATIEKVNRQAQEKFVRESPWFSLLPAVREINAKILWERVLQVAQQEGVALEPYDMADESLEAFGDTIFRLLTKASQMLWNERRFVGTDFNQVNTPFSYFEPNYDHNLDPTPQYTNEELEAAIESGKISLEAVRDMANVQLEREGIAAAQERGEEYVSQRDTDVSISLRPAAPESKKSERNVGFASLMFGHAVDPNRPTR